jgi:hypothetical protein
MEPEVIGSAEEPVPDGTTRDVKLVMRGDAYLEPWRAQTEQGINALLEREGTALRLKLECAPWHPYSDEGARALADASGEVFDLLISEYEGVQDLLIEQNAVADLTQAYIDFPNLYNVNPAQVWSEVAVDGKLYCFPLVEDYYGINAFETTLQLRRDTLKAVGEEPTDAEQLFSAALAAKALANTQDMDIPYKLYMSLQTPPYAFHRTYDEWPFYVDKQSMFVYYKDGSMEPYVGSSVFERDMGLYAQWRSEDMLMLESDAEFGDDAYRDEAFASQPPKFVLAQTEEVDGFTSMVGDGGIVYATLAPGAVNIRLKPSCTYALYVSAHTKSVDDSLRMLQFLYTTRGINDMLVFGPEGEDWELQEDGAALLHTAYSNRLMFSNEFAMRPLTRSEETEDLLSRAVDFPAGGFIYRERNQSAWSALGFDDVYALRAGTLQGKTAEDVLRDMDAAGYQAMLASYKEQYEAFLAGFM